MTGWVLAAALAAAPGVRVEAPPAGWTVADAAELVAAVPPGSRPTLEWLGWSWPLDPAPDGRVAVWLPLFPGDNELAVAARDVGGRSLGSALTRVWRQAAAGALDLVVVAGWAPGLARLDLRVADPAQEDCDASNRRTAAGGLRLRDDPEGPGPHVFMLPRAASGEYRVSILCGRLAPGRFVAVHAFALLFAGTSREERLDLSGVVGRCDVETDLGAVEVVGRGR